MTISSLPTEASGPPIPHLHFGAGPTCDGGYRLAQVQKGLQGSHEEIVASLYPILPPFEDRRTTQQVQFQGSNECNVCLLSPGRR